MQNQGEETGHTGMMQPERITAVVTEMDGVLTDTTEIHFEAWKRVLDEFLSGHNRMTDDNQPSFSSGDYRRHVQGMSRHEGAQVFLQSRGIELPWGDPADGPTDRTACALGNRMNEVFRELFHERGVHPYPDAVAACERWRKGGLPLAIVTYSKDGREVLATARLMTLADTVVDGAVATGLGISGKSGLIREAAARLEVPLSDVMLIDTSIAGVQAGKSAGCRCVVGVNRDRGVDLLKEAGADHVVDSVSAIRFPRAVPSLGRNFEELSALRNGRPLVLFVDFDGTLSPIVNEPAKAQISREMRTALRRVAKHCTVAVVSGRDREYVEQRVRIDGLHYAGNHGLDIAGPKGGMVHPDAGSAVPVLEELEKRLGRELSSIEGVVLERKRFSLAVHYRKVKPDQIGAVQAVTTTVVQELGALRIRSGKMVLEIEPVLAWNKGDAVRWLMNALEVDPAKSLVVYIGDDETDEDAFEALNCWGVGVYVGAEISNTLASYRVRGPAEVQALLQVVGNWSQRHS
jgi:alpha,alpha-trehalase